MTEECHCSFVMARTRSTLISLSDTPWYHLVNQCVRRAFPCGDDKLTGKNFDHRRGWIAERVKQLAGVFAIDVAAYVKNKVAVPLFLFLQGAKYAGTEPKIHSRCYCWCNYLVCSDLSAQTLHRVSSILKKKRLQPVSLGKIRPKAEKNLSAEIRYANEAIYRDLECFFKITLALLGAIAYVATKPERPAPELLEIFLSAAAGLQLVSAVTFSLFIFIHQKSKIERWTRPFTFLGPLLWQETWMVTTMLGISAAIAFGAVPSLHPLLGKSVSVADWSPLIYL